MPKTKQVDLLMMERRLKILEERAPWLLELERRLAFLARKHYDAEKEVRRKKLRYDSARMGRSWLAHIGVPLEWLEEDVREAEERKKRLEEEMEFVVKRHPVYQYYLRHLPGVGPVLAAELLGWLQPWRVKHASAMIKYCGYSGAPTDPHDKRAKTVVHKVVMSMIRRGDENLYRELFEEFQARVMQTECGDGKCSRKAVFMKALRRVKRIFLAHYYGAYVIILKCKVGVDLGLSPDHYVARLHEVADMNAKTAYQIARQAPSRYIPPAVPVRGRWRPLEEVVCTC